MSEFDLTELAVDLRLLESEIAPLVERLVGEMGESTRSAVSATVRAVYLQGYEDGVLPGFRIDPSGAY